MPEPAMPEPALPEPALPSRAPTRTRRRREAGVAVALALVAAIAAVGATVVAATAQTAATPAEDALATDPINAYAAMERLAQDLCDPRLRLDPAFVAYLLTEAGATVALASRDEARIAALTASYRDLTPPDEVAAFCAYATGGLRSTLAGDMAVFAPLE